MKAVDLERAHVEDPGMVSRQRAWALRRLAEGRCKNCGKKRGKKQAALCRECDERERARRGVSAWRRGGPGRPPNWASSHVNGKSGKGGKIPVDAAEVASRMKAGKGGPHR